VAEAANIGSGVHDGIDNGRIPAMPCSDLQPTRNVGVAGIVAGGAGGVITQIARRPAALRWAGMQKRVRRSAAAYGQNRTMVTSVCPPVSGRPLCDRLAAIGALREP